MWFLKRSIATILASTAILAVAASAASAANPVKGATYAGNWKAGRIQFRVSANGKSVNSFAFRGKVPATSRSGALTSSPSIVDSKSAKVTNGSFTVTLRLEGMISFSGTITVTGTFQAHRRAVGTLTTHFVHYLRDQNATNVPYSAKAK